MHPDIRNSSFPIAALNLLLKYYYQEPEVPVWFVRFGLLYSSKASGQEGARPHISGYLILSYSGLFQLWGHGGKILVGRRACIHLDLGPKRCRRLWLGSGSWIIRDDRAVVMMRSIPTHLGRWLSTPLCLSGWTDAFVQYLVNSKRGREGSLMRRSAVQDWGAVWSLDDGRGFALEDV